MNHKKLMALYGIKWNPFSTDIPIEGIIADAKVQKFSWRVENLVMDGGFAMITGPVGSGKSVSMRLIAHNLSKLQDVRVAEISRPQSSVADFYRELGNLFGMDLQVTNRFGSYRSLRDKWMAHIENTLFRPILLIDEAQEMLPAVLSELRLISASSFDSKSIVTVVLSGDERLPEKFRAPDLIPLGSRIKTRLLMESKNREDLARKIGEMTERAGNPALMSEELINTIAGHSMGNYRAAMQMADELLLEGLRRDLPKLDEQLFMDVFDFTQKKMTRRREK